MAEYSPTGEAWRWIFFKPLFTEIEENNCISIYEWGDKEHTIKILTFRHCFHVFYQYVPKCLLLIACIFSQLDHVLVHARSLSCQKNLQLRQRSSFSPFKRYFHHLNKKVMSFDPAVHKYTNWIKTVIVGSTKRQFSSSFQAWFVRLQIRCV